MLTVLISLLQVAAGPTAPVAPPDTPTQMKCLNTKVHQASPTPEAASKLGTLPPGDLHLSVMRKIGDCQIPTAVSFGYGNGRRAQSSR